MAKNTDEGARQSAVREAKRRGESPSAARVTTGASKQLATKRGKEREPKGDRTS